jgi:hypothetical protein
MLSDRNIYACRVCGLLQDEPPWGEDSNTPTFNICECCGTEFGYEDATAKAIQASRARWLSNGARWYLPEFKPENWQLEEQLQQIPPQFR